jgi:hypothetical protein
MSNLSSCYFCGSALDVSLSEYPIVPKQLRIEDRDSTTVVLCDPCRRKLAMIIEEVVETTVGETDIDTTAVDTDIDTTAVDTDTDTVGTETEDERTDSETDVTDDETTETTNSVSAETSEDTDTESSSSDETPGSQAGKDDKPDTEMAVDDDPSLSRLEYNKVMRLLQNRQLPVDRAEIRDIAVSAYDLDPSEFDAVIEAATERELIAEHGGQFVEPE